MRIERVGTAGVSRTRRSNKVAAKGGGSFSDALAGSADATESVARAAVASPVTAILAAQEVPDASQGRSIKRFVAMVGRDIQFMHQWRALIGSMTPGPVATAAIFLKQGLPEPKFEGHIKFRNCFPGVDRG